MKFSTVFLDFLILIMFLSLIIQEFKSFHSENEGLIKILYWISFFFVLLGRILVFILNKFFSNERIIVLLVLIIYIPIFITYSLVTSISEMNNFMNFFNQMTLIEKIICLICMIVPFLNIISHLSLFFVKLQKYLYYRNLNQNYLYLNFGHPRMNFPQTESLFFYRNNLLPHNLNLLKSEDAESDIFISKSSIICSICCDNIEKKEKILVLDECKHIFHSKCIKKWLIKKSNCPNCKRNLITE